MTGAEGPLVGMSSAEKMRAKRERDKAAGLCVGGCGNKPRKGKATCEECNERAKDAVKRSRG